MTQNRPIGPSAFDPVRAQRRLLWRNRAARWCGAPAETGFHLLAALLFLALLTGWILPHLASAESRQTLQRLIDAAPWACLLGIGVLAALQLRRQLAIQRDEAVTGWLMAQPVAERWRRRERWRSALIVLSGFVLPAALLLRWIERPGTDVLWLVLAVSLGIGLALAAVRRQAARPGAQAVAPTRSAAIDPRTAGVGRLWRWQARAAMRGLAPRSLRHAAWLLLLVPAGGGPVLVASVVCAALLVTGLTQAWRCSLATLFEAQQWLEAQPGRARFWWAGLRVPAALALVAALLSALALRAAGADQVWVWAGIAVLATGLLQACTVLAHRRSKARAHLGFMLQMTLLLGVLQAIPPLLPLLWLGLVMHSLVRAARV